MNPSRFSAVIPTGAAAFTATPSSALVKFRVESRQDALDSPASVEELERLREYVNSVCPVLDLISNPTPVHIELLTPTAQSARTAA